MPATIKIKNSSTASAVPTSSDLVQGELAVNVTDKRLFTENASGTVVELGTNPSILTLPDGSASAPTLTNDGDTNTGIFFPAADTVGITTGGTERARVDSAGNLGLGVTPSAWGTLKALEFAGATSVASDGTAIQLTSNAYFNGTNWIYKNSAGAGNYYINNNTHNWRIAGSGTAGNAITFTQAMTLDASGNLLVGTTTTPSNAGFALGSTSSGKNFSLFSSSNGNNGIAYFYQSSGANEGQLYAGSGNLTIFGASVLRFTNNSGESARITSSGTWLVGRTAASDTTLGFQVDSAGRVNAAISTDNSYLLYSTAASAYRFYVTNGGQINATSTSITAISDQSLKENIRDIDTGLSQVLALRPRRFDWKEETAIGEKDVAGFIAQEVEEVLPELVYEYQYSEGVTKKSLKMGDILPTLVKAIQEQQALIVQLQADVAALKGQA